MLFRLMCLLHGHVTGDIPVLASPHGGWRGPPHSSLQRPRERVEAAVGSWGVDERSGSGAQHAPPQGHRAVWIYFFAMKVYLPLSPDSLSSQITVHLPESVNFAFTAPFLVSYTAHTSSLFSETDHA